jgi:glycine/D-amino acid oxidase-like deaminating enzyme
MSSIVEPTLDQALTLARRLSPQDRATLIARLVQELVLVPAPAAASTDDPWAQWAALREEISREHPDARLAERLEADRRERDLALRGSAKASDVHP